MSGDEGFASAGYAIESATMQLDFDDPGPFVSRWVLGDSRITATSGTERALFLGVAPAREVDPYLEGVGHSMVMDFDAGFWAVSSSGTGTQTVTWPVESGNWTPVVMNADGTRGVAADVAIGATIPALGWLVGILLAIASLLLLLSALLLFLALRSTGHARRQPPRLASSPANPIREG